MAARHPDDNNIYVVLVYDTTRYMIHRALNECILILVMYTEIFFW